MDQIVTRLDETPARADAPEADPEPDDDALLRGVAEGSERSFDLLMQKYARPMLRLAERVTGVPAEAEDIVQTAFLKVWIAAQDWTEGDARFSTWLYRVVLNACLDRRRRRKPSVELDQAGELTDDEPGGFDAAAGAERARLVREAISGLPQRQRDALTLHYFGGLTAKEAAASMGVTRSGMEALLVRGRRGLKAALIALGVFSLYDLM